MSDPKGYLLQSIPGMIETEVLLISDQLSRHLKEWGAAKVKAEMEMIEISAKLKILSNLVKQLKDRTAQCPYQCPIANPPSIERLIHND